MKGAVAEYLNGNGGGGKYEHLGENLDEGEGLDDNIGKTYFEVELENGRGKGTEQQDGRSYVVHDGDDQGEGPRDERNLCYLAYFSLGTGVLFPFNAFITAVDYFQDLYPDQHVDRVFTVAYMFPNLVVLGLLLVNDLNLTYNKRIYSGFTLYLFCLFSVPLIDVALIGEESTGSTWNFTVAAVAICGLADGVAQGSVFGSAAVLPARYTQAVVSGTSVSGVVISVLRVLTKALISQDEAGLRRSTYLYFGVAGTFCVFCIFVQAALSKLPVYRHFMGLNAGDEEKAGLTQSDAGAEGQPVVEEEGSSIRQIFSRTWPLGLGLFFSYAVTLSIFPGFLAEDVESETLGDWYAIVLILGFNVMDFIGKSCPVYERFRLHSAVGLFMVSIFRCAFYILYILATFGPEFLKGEPLGPMYVSVITAFLGFSNGWLTSNCLMKAPSLVNHRDAEKTEMLMVWFLLLGLMVGALLGWLWLL